MVKARLAKISRPRLFGVEPRERLFELLDRKRQRSVVWLSATPGAGKTATVASYLENRKLAGIWCQVDSDDGDPSTLLHYLAMAAPSKPRPLPPLTPEYLPTLPAFTRRWFRQLFARLPNPSVIVLDNYQEIPVASPLHGALAHALEEIPPGGNIVFISREDPPSEFARLLAYGSIALIGWEELRLTPDETARIAHSRAPLDKASILTLHERSNGWIAGLTLMLERLPDFAAAAAPGRDQSRQTVFDYFAGQVFDGASSEMRELLVRTALLPRITATSARKITGNLRASALLESLYRRHLFIDRREGPEPSYQYHALFREFLSARARDLLDPSEIAALLSRAAGMAESRGDADDAFALYAENSDWSAAVRIVLNCAEVMLRQGRGRLLRDWIGRLPDSERTRHPWIQYWEGASLIAEAPLAARTRLEPAFGRFIAQRNLLGQALTAAAVVETYCYEWSDFRRLDAWLPVLEQVLSRDMSFPSREAELRAYSGYVFALSRRRPSHHGLPAALEHTLRLIELPLEVNQRVIAATILSSYYHWVLDFKTPHRLISLIEPILGEPTLTPLNRCLWLSRIAFWFWRIQDYKRAAAAVEEAIPIALDNELRNVLTWLYFGRHMTLSTRNDVPQMQRNVEEIEAMANPAHMVDCYQLAIARAELALRADDSRSAERHLQAMAESVDRSGAVYLQARHRVWLAALRAQCGDSAGAKRAVLEARTLLAGAPFHFLLHQCKLVDAFVSIHEARRDHGLVLLAEAFRDREGIASLNDFVLCGRALVTRLCESALRAGREVATAQELIKHYGLQPSDLQLETWPWPLRINALGSFAVVRNDSPLATKGKSPTRLLQLLKMIIANGRGNLSAPAGAALLWPEVDGDAAEQNLDIALSRLRKLLGVESAILLQDNKLSLDRTQCWVDAWAFEDLGARAASLSPVELIGEAYRALDLYHGHFLAQDDEPWVLPMRERLRQMMIHLVLAAADACASDGRWEDAAHFCQRGLSLENLSEPLYRRLMQLHRDRGERAEALNVYHRCHDMLSTFLGVGPSTETQALLTSLQR